MWYEKSAIYQIYPLGLCGAPTQNDGKSEHRILKVLQFVGHIKEMGFSAVLFNPLFESDAHGYDSRDFSKVDCRLGTNEDFKKVCDEFHKNGIKIILDGVFNHVGRGFFAFQDVLKNKWDSRYKDWFNISFDGNTDYNDGFWYEAWEGHYELAKLNLYNSEVRNYIFENIKKWVNEFDIDGLRLDVAYCLNDDFLSSLRHFVSELKPEFWLFGEILHGDYNRWMNDNACHSVTNYECYKGLYSSFNCANMHEISYSLNRQFGCEPWCLYTGKHLVNFVDNHDVSRIATILDDKNQLPVIYGLLFAMPGIPCVYYGSEWGVTGEKSQGDNALRPNFDKPEFNSLSEIIKKYIDIHKNREALCFGSFKNLFVQPKQLVFERCFNNERIIVAINISNEQVNANFDSGTSGGTDLISNKSVSFEGGLKLPPYSVMYIKV